MKEIESHDFIDVLILMNTALERSLTVVEKDKLRNILIRWDVIYEANKIKK
tara:strand:+ start:170 stop:322 length:153 start_codon:yes stop_codon:yes gene_type:complete